MSEPSLNYVACPDAGNGHRMAYWQWGDANAARVVVCVHGLSRQGRDFDVLCAALIRRSASPLRVVAVDVAGRGRSEWLADPSGYQIPTYVGDMFALLTHLHAQARIEALDWVGTSMGGLIGMALAGQGGGLLPAPVRALVLNDVGPVVAWGALERIGKYLGTSVRFESEQQGADALLAISASFGPHTPEQWLALTRPMLKPHAEGGFTLHYDPAIAVPFRSLTREAAAQGEAMLWQLYDAITARTLLIRGAESDLLTPHTAQQMTQRGPKALLVEIAGVGHAPTLVADDQVDLVCDFLLDGPSASP